MAPSLGLAAGDGGGGGAAAPPALAAAAEEPAEAAHGDARRRRVERRLDAPAALYPPCPADRLRSTLAAAPPPPPSAGLISPDRCLSSHTSPDEPDRRNVSLDRCSPAMDRSIDHKNSRNSQDQRPRRSAIYEENTGGGSPRTERSNSYWGGEDSG